MKQRLKQISKFIAICALVVLSSCEKDLYEEGIKNEEKQMIEKVSLDDLPFLKNDISQKQKAMKKVANKEGDIDYLSLIRTDEVYMSTDVNGLKTYTFGLNLAEFEKLTNVVVKETLNDGFKYSLIKYTSPQYNEWITSVIQNENPDVTPDVKITDLEEKFEACISYNISFTCPSTEQHTIDEQNVCTYELSQWDITISITSGPCEGSSGSEPATNGGYPGTTPGGTTVNTTVTNTNTGTNGGSGIGTTPTIITPVPPFGSHETIIDEPCTRLKALTDNSEFQTQLNYLKTQVNSRKETAVKMENIVNFAGDMEKKFTRVTSNNEYNAVVNYSQFLYGSAHNHTKDSQSIPSWVDLLWLRDLDEYIYLDRNIGQAVNIVVVRNSQNATLPPILYALTIQDYNALNQQINNDLQSVSSAETESDKLTELLETFGNKFANDQDVTTDLEKRFLKVYHNYGINLFKFDEATNKWNKLKLQYPYNPYNPNATNSVIAEPCNN